MGYSVWKFGSYKQRATDWKHPSSAGEWAQWKRHLLPSRKAWVQNPHGRWRDLTPQVVLCLPHGGRGGGRVKKEKIVYLFAFCWPRAAWGRGLWLTIWAGSWSRGHRETPLTGMLNLFPYTKPKFTWPGVAEATVGWILPHELSKCPQTRPVANLLEAVPQMKFHLPGCISFMSS